MVTDELDNNDSTPASISIDNRYPIAISLDDHSVPKHFKFANTSKCIHSWHETFD